VTRRDLQREQGEAERRRGLFNNVDSLESSTIIISRKRKRRRRRGNPISH